MPGSNRAPQADARTRILDSARSTIQFRVRSAIPAKGRFTESQGTMAVDGEAGDELTASIGVDSLTTGLGLRDKHLKSVHFLNAERHPKIEYRGRLTQTGKAVRVVGTLTLCGVERPVDAHRPFHDRQSHQTGP